MAGEIFSYDNGRGAAYIGKKGEETKDFIFTGTFNSTVPTYAPIIWKKIANELEECYAGTIEIYAEDHGWIGSKAIKGLVVLPRAI